MTQHEHLDFDGWCRLVEELLRGKIRRWLDLLRCPECRRRVRRLFALQDQGPVKEPTFSDEVMLDRFRRELARATDDATRAEKVLERFLGAPKLQRRFWVENSSLRGNLALCQKVLQRAEAAVTDAPGKARDLATVALELADLADEEPEHRARLWEDCRAGAWLIRGRVHGWFGEFDAAHEALQRSSLIHQKGSCDPMERHKILRVEVFLSSHEDRFETAVKKTWESIHLCRSIGDKHNEMWHRIGLAHIFYKADRSNQALWLSKKARRFASDEIDLRQELYQRHNEVTSLIRLHEFSWARRLFDASQSLYETFGDSMIQVRRIWTAGQLTAGLEGPKEARMQYEQTRRKVHETWGDYDTAMVALDYGRLYVELGWMKEATRLLEQALPFLKARSLPQMSKAEELLAKAARPAP